MAGSALTCCSMRKALSQLCGARCLKPYPGKPDVRNFRGAAGNVVYGGTAHPPAIERAGPEKPPPKDARASSLPNKGKPPTSTASRASVPVRGQAKRRQRYGRAGPLSIEKTMVRGAGAFRAAEGNIAGIFLARCRRAPRCEGAHARPHAFCRDPGRSSIRPACRGGTVWGKEKAEARDGRLEEAGRGHATCDVGEQGSARSCGAAGGKGLDQGESGKPRHAPNAVSGKRDTGGGPDTASCGEKPAGASHGAFPPHDAGGAWRVVLRAEGGRGCWCRKSGCPTCTDACTTGERTGRRRFGGQGCPGRTAGHDRSGSRHRRTGSSGKRLWT